jgi:hypothetical protein
VHRSDVARVGAQASAFGELATLVEDVVRRAVNLPYGDPVRLFVMMTIVVVVVVVAVRVVTCFIVSRLFQLSAPECERLVGVLRAGIAASPDQWQARQRRRHSGVARLIAI